MPGLHPLHAAGQGAAVARTAHATVDTVTPGSGDDPLTLSLVRCCRLSQQVCAEWSGCKHPVSQAAGLRMQPCRYFIQRPLHWSPTCTVQPVFEHCARQPRQRPGRGSFHPRIRQAIVLALKDLAWNRCLPKTCMSEAVRVLPLLLFDIL